MQGVAAAPVSQEALLQRLTPEIFVYSSVGVHKHHLMSSVDLEILFKFYSLCLHRIPGHSDRKPLVSSTRGLLDILVNLSPMLHFRYNFLMCFGDVCVYLGTSVRLSLTDSNHIPILIFKTDILGNFFCFECQPYHVTFRPSDKWSYLLCSIFLLLVLEFFCRPGWT